MLYTVKDRQTLLDIALLTSGSFEAAYDLAIANGMSVTDEPESAVTVQTVDVVNSDVIIEYVANGIVPASIDSRPTQSQQGVGYWFIGVDFVVS